MFKLTKHTSITRLSDNASIPADPANRDYQDYLTWVALGNTATPAQTPAEITAEAIATTNAIAKAELLAIDLASVRSIREYIAAKPDAPVFLKTQEAAAITARTKIKP